MSLLVCLEQHQVVGHHITDVQIDDPVHEVEADKAHRKHDPRVLVNVTGRDSVQFVDVLARVHDVLWGQWSDVAVVVPAAVDGVLQRTALEVVLWIVGFESHLLEQTGITYKGHRNLSFDWGPIFQSRMDVSDFQPMLTTNLIIVLFYLLFIQRIIPVKSLKKGVHRFQQISADVILL